MPENEDRRVQRTRSALLHAFASLVLEPRRYDQIKVGDIVERANVGRSTFYEHYRNKDEILAESIKRPFSAFARSVDTNAGAAGLNSMLEHFWANRGQSRAIFVGARRKVSRILAVMLQERLNERINAITQVDAQRIKVAALALAEAQVGTLAAWLSGEIACDQAVMAEVLHGMAQAAAAQIGEPRT